MRRYQRHLYSTAYFRYCTFPAASLAAVKESCAQILANIGTRSNVSERIAILQPQNEVYLQQFNVLAAQYGLQSHRISKMEILISPKLPNEAPPLSQGDVVRVTEVLKRVANRQGGYVTWEKLFLEATPDELKTMYECMDSRQRSFVYLLESLPKTMFVLKGVDLDYTGVWTFGTASENLITLLADVLRRQPTKRIEWKSVMLSKVLTSDELKAIDELFGANKVVDGISLKRLVIQRVPRSDIHPRLVRWDEHSMFLVEGKDADDCGLRDPKVLAAKSLLAYVENMLHIKCNTNASQSFVPYSTLTITYPRKIESFQKLFESTCPLWMRPHIDVGPNGLQFKKCVVETEPVAGPPGEPEPVAMCFKVLREMVDRNGGQGSFRALVESATDLEYAALLRGSNLTEAVQYKSSTLRKFLERYQSFAPKDFFWDANGLWILPDEKTIQAQQSPADISKFESMNKAQIEEEIFVLMGAALLKRGAHKNKMRWNKILSGLNPLELTEYKTLKSIYRDKTTNTRLQCINASSAPFFEFWRGASQGLAKDIVIADAHLVGVDEVKYKHLLAVRKQRASKTTTSQQGVLQPQRSSEYLESAYLGKYTIPTGTFTGHLEHLRTLFIKLKEYDTVHKAYENVKLSSSMQWNSLPTVEFVPPKGEMLPIREYEDSIIQHIAENDVTILRGSTGCGKSTQVPQYLLNYIARKGGGKGRIICTEPRRIAATSLAKRVVDERDPLRRDVGYIVRFENNVTESTALIFMTVGILLQMLQTNSSLNGVTHVILDEVHERGVDTDFVLIILKRLAVQKKLTFKLILMSATVDVSKFQLYFQSENLKVGTIDVPVPRKYPIEIIHLEKFLQHLPGSHIPEKPQKKKVHPSWRMDDEESQGGDPRLPKYGDLVDIHKLTPSVALSVHHAHTSESEAVDLSLVIKTVQHLHRTHPNDKGAILVFLPGMKEILHVRKALQSSLNNADFFICLLHSSLSMAEQNMVYDEAPQNTRKVVLATNIAETSITIPDIVYVVDTGKVNAATFSPNTQMSHLGCTSISQSCANQRSGRAGRVRAGKVIRLYTSWDYSLRMSEFFEPEMRRVATEDLCMKVLSLGLGDVHEVLSLALDPPSRDQVESGMEVLRSLGALEGGNSLTTLGKKMATYPVHPRLAKFILMSEVFDMKRMGLGVAAGLSGQNGTPFMAPNNHIRKDLKSVRLSYGEGMQSDLWALGQAVDTYRVIPAHRKSEWCVENFISSRVMEEVWKIIGSIVGLKPAEIMAASVQGGASTILKPNQNIAARFQCAVAACFPITYHSPNIKSKRITVQPYKKNYYSVKFDPMSVIAPPMIKSKASHSICPVSYVTAMSVHDKTRLLNISLLEILPALLMGVGHKFTKQSDAHSTCLLSGTAFSMDIHNQDEVDALIEIKSMIDFCIAFGAKRTFSHPLVSDFGNGIADVLAPSMKFLTASGPENPTDVNVSAEDLFGDIEG